MILQLLGYIGLVVGFLFLTLAIASGLYYLSEIVEEHTVLSKKLLYRLIYGVIGVNVLLVLFDGFPFFLCCFSIASHIVYSANLSKFPVVKLTDPIFIVSCLLVALNHYLWFHHFSTSPDPYGRRRGSGSYYSSPTPPFRDVASYFGLCVWLVPFALFISLSASDNILPTIAGNGNMGDSGNGLGDTTGKSKREGRGLVKLAVEGVRDFVMRLGKDIGLIREDRGL